MNDVLVVRGRKRVGTLPRDRQRLAQRNWPLRDPIGERRTFDEFHGERLDAAALFKPVKSGNVGVIERREHFCFALKTREPIRIRRHRTGQHLQRDLALQPRVGCAIDLAHTADADLLVDFVRSDPRTRGKCSHLRWREYSRALFAPFAHRRHARCRGRHVCGSGARVSAKPRNPANEMRFPASRAGGHARHRPRSATGR